MNMAVAFSRTNDQFEMTPNFMTGIRPANQPWHIQDYIPIDLGDLNGDGKADLILIRWRKFGGNYDYPLEMEGHLSPNRGLDMFNWKPADISGDGIQDMVYLYYLNPGYRIYTLLGNINGTYTRTETNLSTTGPPNNTNTPLDNPDANSMDADGCWWWIEWRTGRQG